MDERFSYADPKAKSSSGEQLITGNEVKTFLARGNPTNFNFGNTYEFPVDSVPIAIGEQNYMEVSVVFRKKLLTDKGNTWISCDASDLDYLCLAENFGSALIESVAMRQGLDNLEIDAFVPRGRYLWENFLLAHVDPSVKRHYTYADQDPAIHTYMTSDKFAPGTEAYSDFLDDGDKLGTGLRMHVVPHCFPFQWKTRGDMHESLFPNTGNPLSILVRLISDYRQLFHVQPKDPANPTTDPVKHSYKIEVTDLKLHLGVPRFSAQGLKLITNRNLAPLRWDSNFVVQFTQTVPDESVEINFSLASINLPEYLVLQTYDQDYWTGEPLNDYTRPVYKPIALSTRVKRTRIRFGNRDLSYETGNFDVQQPESKLMRQAIMKHSDVFEARKMDQTYWADMPDYQQSHLMFSFCSDEKNHTLLRPLDYSGPPNDKQTLSVTLYGSERAKFRGGKLLITLIYRKVGFQYDVKTGTFLERDIKSLVVSG